jgi:ribosomal protein S18 acetylase RimI-like enzyme
MPDGSIRPKGHAHPLDHVVWEALASRHRYLAEGDERALRYPADVAPFAATLDTSPESFRSLQLLIPAGDRIALFTVEEVSPPSPLSVVKRDLVDQMIFINHPPSVGMTPVVRLNASDVPEMQALVDATHPGPFNTRTIELGAYFGIRHNGKLVAMAGERMRLDGFAEVSGVCVHPSYRGLGWAAELVNVITGLIAFRGETPFLHVFASNRPAIELYGKLGFILRRRMHLAILMRAVPEPYGFAEFKTSKD